MSLWEDVSTSYIDAATSVLPLHRAVVFAVAFAGSLAVRDQTHLSILETLAQWPISALTTLSIGPLSKGLIADAMAAVVITGLGWVYSRLTLRAVFAMAARATNLWKRVDSSSALVRIDLDQPLADRNAAVELIDAALAGPRSRLRSRTAVAELTASLGIGALGASVWGNVIDLLFGLTLIIGTVGVQVGAVRLFLSEYFGPALLKAQLQGKNPPRPTDIS